MGWITGSVAALPAVALVLIVVALLIEAWPAIKVTGFGFFTHTAFDLGDTYGTMTSTNGVAHPSGASYGVLGWLLGTIASSLLALVLAVPVSILAALAIVDRLPRRIGSAIGTLIEILAGIPSVIIGLWGALTLGPALASTIYPKLASLVPDVPVLRFFGGNTGNGEGLLTAGIVLAVMIIPIVTATARDLFRTTPYAMKDGALALGMTDAEVAWRVTLRWSRSGLIGACVLGLARAVGETMAVAMVSGVVLSGSPTSIFAPMTTIAATIVTQLDSAFTDPTGFSVHALAYAGLVLALISLIVNGAARVLVNRAAAVGDALEPGA